MSNYFTAYETKRSLYKEITPGTVWKFKHSNITIAVQRIDPVNKLAWGICCLVPDEINAISFEYLVEYYNLQKRGI
jgi:hypothetical protein